MHTQHAWRRAALLVGLPLAAQLALAGPAAAHPASGYKLPVAPAHALRLAAGPQPLLAGITPQQQPIVLRFNADASVLSRALTTLHLKCTSGASFYLPDGFTNLDVSALRHFRTTYSLPPQPVDATTTIALSGSMSGQVDKTGTRASGTWRMTEVETNPTTNAVTDTCASGVVRFSVHR
jgi:hypothetical protein